MSGERKDYSDFLSELTIDGKSAGKYYALNKLEDQESVAKLPISIKVLLESALRNCDGFEVTAKNVNDIVNWKQTSTEKIEIPFKPARVILQDFTGVPAVVDLAAMRTAIARLGGDMDKINPLVPADLVIDHSVQVDHYGNNDAVQKNLKREMERNSERFQFLKWGATAFKQFQIVPPGSGIVHQVNLEYLARVVFDTNDVLYPDSLVGTDSHTTMINGLGVTGWGVGGIEAEAVMLGQAVSMVLPEVIGYKITGELQSTCTATDLVLTIVEHLRARGVVGKFVEFFGPGLVNLSLADRATIANMAPEYGATMGFFPIDQRTVEYLTQTNRGEAKIAKIEAYLRAQGMFVDHSDTKAQDQRSYTDVMTLDLSSIQPCVAGPKRPHDRVNVADLQKDFKANLSNPVGFKGFGLTPEQIASEAKFTYEGKQYTLNHGDVVIAAITSCTNTSNPSVLLGAGLLAKNALKKGLKINPYIKTSLAPGSGVVTKYLAKSGLQESLDALGFNIVGFGCTTCIGNSGDIATEVSEAIAAGDIVSSAVLSGNRNFEGRVHPLTRANYLASPPLVIAYALAGTVDIDFESQPLGKDADGNDVFLRDIWPSRQDISELVNTCVVASMFAEVYASITDGTEEWNALQVPDSKLYDWETKSTYISHPPFFQTMGREVDPVADIKDARALLNLGDSITTDHISPAGKIARNSPAATYLRSLGVADRDFNTYGARRGNDNVMARGTFANTRLVNEFCPDKPGPYTMHVPSGEIGAVWDVAARYMESKTPVIILGGAMYGSGSSRDWAAKGPLLQGVKAVIATSYERIHRSNLVGMGILPLQYKSGESAKSLGLTGTEEFSILLSEQTPLAVGQDITVTTKGGKTFVVESRLDTAVELAYYQNGGILQYVIRRLCNE